MHRAQQIEVTHCSNSGKKQRDKEKAAGSGRAKKSIGKMEGEQRERHGEKKEKRQKVGRRKGRTGSKSSVWLREEKVERGKGKKKFAQGAKRRKVDQGKEAANGQEFFAFPHKNIHFHRNTGKT